MLSMQELFEALYFSPTEENVEKIIQQHPTLFKTENWCPIGENESNFSIFENQQSNPIAALVEKVTNSIDAILMKKCLKKGIAPKSSQAPQSMEEAIEILFPDHKNWDLSSFRRQQAEDIQIIADGPRQQSAVIIYDNGEGQHPVEFENTFLSLMRGNKMKSALYKENTTWVAAELSYFAEPRVTSSSAPSDTTTKACSGLR